jgi:vacuolar-type H+-ATPase subunit B/Vma2
MRDLTVVLEVGELSAVVQRALPAETRFNPAARAVVLGMMGVKEGELQTNMKLVEEEGAPPKQGRLETTPS